MKYQKGDQVRTISTDNSNASPEMIDAHEKGVILTVTDAGTHYCGCRAKDLAGGEWYYDICDIVPHIQTKAELLQKRNDKTLSDDEFLEGLTKLKEEA